MPDSQPQGGGSANLSPAPGRQDGVFPRLLAWYARSLARLFRRRPSPGAAGVPYQVVCACGQAVRGVRQERFQVVPCPACRAGLFVLPRSPLPTVRGAPGGGPLPTAAPPPLRGEVPPRRRRALLIALGLVALAGAAALVVALSTTSAPRPADGQAPSSSRAEPSGPRLRQAERLLAQGQFHQALAECDAALAPGALAPPDRRALTQVRRQAALLADLSAESVEEMLRNAAGLSAVEWEATFRRRYRSKALVLDTEVVRTADGRYRHGWRVPLPGEEARLELDGLAVLGGLPLEQSQRLVLGARLDSARREAPGGWVVRLASDSGVLLTDPEAAALCCPKLADEGSRQVLRRQRTWVLGAAPGQGVAKAP